MEMLARLFPLDPSDRLRFWNQQHREGNGMMGGGGELSNLERVCENVKTYRRTTTQPEKIPSVQRSGNEGKKRAKETEKQ